MARKTTPKPVKKAAKASESAMNVVLDKMKELFLSGALKPGDLLLPENELAKSMKVSRGSIREAMKVLDAFGLIEIKRGNGTYVSTAINARSFNPLLFHLVFEGQDFRHMVELRQCIELEIVKLAIRHASEEDFAAVRRILADMEEEISRGDMDSARIFHYELLFHHAVGETTHNPLMKRIYDFVMEFFTPSILVTANEHTTDSGRQSLALHRDILAAVEARDLVGAEYAIVNSLLTWQRSYARHINPGE